MSTETIPVLTEYVGEERRDSPRSEVLVQARLECADEALDGKIINLSLGGACFVTDHPTEAIAVGAAAVLTLIPPPNTMAGELHWTATVVRRRERTEDALPATEFGLQFDQPTPTARHAKVTETQPLTDEL